LYISGTAANYLDGRLGVGVASSSYAMAQIINTTAADRALVVRGAASQTGDLLDVQNSAGASQFKVDSNGNVGIGTTPGSGINLLVQKPFVQSAGGTGYGIYSNQTIQSDVTGGAYINLSQVNTAAQSFTLSQLYNYFAWGVATPGAGSTIATQTGFIVNTTFTGATTNIGFRGQIPSGTGRWNVYMDGTADNYMAGALGIGGFASAGQTIYVNRNITGATTGRPVFVQSTIQSDVTTGVNVFGTGVSTQAASFTLANLNHFNAGGIATPGAGSTILNQTGFSVTSGMTGATNNYAFFSQIASGTNRWNLYMDGTAANYLAGRLGVGATLTSGGMVQITNTTAADKALIIKGATSQTGDLFDVQTSSGYSLFRINSSGAGWFRQEANGLQINLNLGRMDDGLTTPLYQVQTDDTLGDILRFFCTRWSSNVKFARSSALGDRDMVTISGGAGDNRIEIFNDSNVVNSRIVSNGTSFLNGGNVGIGIEGATSRLHVVQSVAANVGVIVRGASSQTANLQQWQNSAGTILAYVAADGSSSFTEGDQNVLAVSVFS